MKTTHAVTFTFGCEVVAPIFRLAAGTLWQDAIMAPGGMVLEPIEIARLATEAAADKQAVDVVILDVRGSCSFSDYFVVSSGESERQLEAIWDAILDALKARDEVALHKEGSAASGWMLADYGAVVIHIFAPEEREYYQLEQLWKDAVQVLRIQ